MTKTKMIEFQWRKGGKSISDQFNEWVAGQDWIKVRKMTSHINHNEEEWLVETLFVLYDYDDGRKMMP